MPQKAGCAGTNKVSEIKYYLKKNYLYYYFIILFLEFAALIEFRNKERNVRSPS